MVRSRTKATEFSLVMSLKACGTLVEGLVLIYFFHIPFVISPPRTLCFVADDKTGKELSKEKTNLMPLILLFYSMFIQCSTCFGR